MKNPIQIHISFYAKGSVAYVWTAVLPNSHLLVQRYESLPIAGQGDLTIASIKVPVITFKCTHGWGKSMNSIQKSAKVIVFEKDNRVFWGSGGRGIDKITSGDPIKLIYFSIFNFKDLNEGNVFVFEYLF